MTAWRVWPKEWIVWQQPSLGYLTVYSRLKSLEFLPKIARPINWCWTVEIALATITQFSLTDQVVARIEFPF